MFLAVNIDNFEIEFFSIDHSGKIVSSFSISSLESKTVDQYVSDIKNAFAILKLERSQIIDAGIISSVPKLTHLISEFFQKYLRIVPFVVDNKRVPVSAEVANIDEMQTVSLISVYAGAHYYKDNFIIVNLNSIISFTTFINGKIEGYSLYPGLGILSSAVHNSIPTLPDVFVQKSENLLEKDNYKALNSGLFNGCIGACSNIISSIKSDISDIDLSVIAVGKDSKLLASYIREINVLDKDLHIKGVALLAKKRLASV